MATKRNMKGWKRDPHDPRDHILKAAPMPKALPPRAMDMLKMMPPVYNQTSLGSCTAQGVGALAQFTEVETLGVGRKPSMLQIYYDTRVLQKTVDEDSGASIRNAMKALVAGYCRSTLWPYDVKKFKVAPSAAARAEAKTKAIKTGYSRVEQTIEAIKTQIAGGNPVVFGFEVYDSFDKAAKTGYVPMPSNAEIKAGTDSGHCMLIIGYDDAKMCFYVRNSWGSRWGDKGNCWMPYSYLASRAIASDFWTLTKVTPWQMASAVDAPDREVA